MHEIELSPASSLDEGLKKNIDKHEHSNLEFIFSILCGVFLTLGFGSTFINSVHTALTLSFYILAYFFGGFYTTKEAYEGILSRKFEIDFLMLLAAVGSAVLGNWAEGALLLFLFAIGHSLEHYAMGKARRSIAALAGLAPTTALVKKGNTEIEVAIEKLILGDVIIIKPNSKISADGVIIKGESSVNQAPITGESMPVDKISIICPAEMYLDDKSIKAENKVFAGTINGNHVLEVKVTKLAADSTLARLIKLVNETESQKSPTQLFTDKIQKYYVPSVLVLIGVLMFAFLVVEEPFSQSFYRAMAVLVAASPCALAISTPSAVLSGIARAARAGVLFKGGGPMELLGNLRAIAFDKTGTLTQGKPRLTHVIALNGFTEEEVLEMAVAVEKLSDHPLAAAVVKDGQERLHREIQAAENLQSVTGHGVKANLGGNKITIGNKRFFFEVSEDIKKQVEALEKEGNTTMLIQKNEKIAGVISLMDIPRPEAKETLKALKTNGIRKMVMLTGDNQLVANAVAENIGINEAWGSLLPEDKVSSIETLMAREGKVAMVGDGVNDAPAMAKSTVGIAMGAAGSDVALETADIALMADKLDNLPFAIGLSRKAHDIIRQNLLISLGMIAVLIPLTISGYAKIGPAVVGHEGSTVLVVLNALRLLGFKADKV
ncbi:MAG: heavy metal translocating P-type ATPase [Sphingobacteriaceae bacterium]|nr:heavy metal translocating P-type ATPase [Sphingobacteriaceae bacterium]